MKFGCVQTHVNLSKVPYNVDTFLCCRLSTVLRHEKVLSTYYWAGFSDWRRVGRLTGKNTATASGRAKNDRALSTVCYLCHWYGTILRAQGPNCDGLSSSEDWSGYPF